jgi:hypothetical protein
MKSSKLIKQVIVRLQIEGIHSWDNCNIPDVDFLKYPHRHIFHIEVGASVEDSDREIEIIMLKRRIKEYLGDEPVMFYGLSCEMIAENILKQFDADYVIVLEDNENGAKITAI